MAGWDTNWGANKLPLRMCKQVRDALCERHPDYGDIDSSDYLPEMNKYAILPSPNSASSGFSDWCSEFDEKLKDIIPNFVNKDHGSPVGETDITYYTVNDFNWSSVPTSISNAKKWFLEKYNTINKLTWTYQYLGGEIQWSYPEYTYQVRTGATLVVQGQHKQHEDSASFSDLQTDWNNESVYGNCDKPFNSWSLGEFTIEFNNGNSFSHYSNWINIRVENKPANCAIQYFLRVVDDYLSPSDRAPEGYYPVIVDGGEADFGTSGTVNLRQSIFADNVPPAQPVSTTWTRNDGTTKTSTIAGYIFRICCNEVIVKGGYEFQ